MAARERAAEAALSRARVEDRLSEDARRDGDERSRQRTGSRTSAEDRHEPVDLALRGADEAEGAGQWATKDEAVDDGWPVDPLLLVEVCVDEKGGRNHTNCPPSRGASQPVVGGAKPPSGRGGPRPNPSHPFKCPGCERSYMHRRSLRTHLKQQPCAAAPQRCQTCGKAFRDRRDLAVHAAHVCGREMWRPCPRCNKLLDRSGGEGHRCGAEGRVHCPKCDLQFEDAEGLATHALKDKCGKELRCPICNKVFKYKHNLGTHVLHECGKELRCPTCGKLCRQVSALNAHVKYECGRELRCGRCGARFQQARSLNTHVRQECMRELRCAKCNAAFRQLRTLTVHMRNECGRLIQCSKCNVRFKRLSSRARHLRKCGGVITVE